MLKLIKGAIAIFSVLALIFIQVTPAAAQPPWSLETTLTEATGNVLSVAFSQDNNWIAYGSADDNVYVHDINDSWNLETTLTEATNWARSVAFSQDNNWIAYGGNDDNVYVHDINDSWNLETTLTEATAFIESVAFSQDNNWIAYGVAANFDYNVFIHDINDNWALETTLAEAILATIYSVAFSQDNNWIAYGGNDDNIYVHDMPQAPAGNGDDNDNGNGTDGIINEGDLPEELPETGRSFLALLGLVLIPILSFNLWYYLSRHKKRI